MCRNGILKGEMIKKKSLVFQLIQKEKKNQMPAHKNLIINFGNRSPSKIKNVLHVSPLYYVVFMPPTLWVCMQLWS